MGRVSLTKAGRLQDRIRAAIRQLQLENHVTISIFTPEPEAMVEREAARLREDVDILERLLAILAALRAATGRANAEHGVGGLLAEKAALDEEVRLLLQLLPAPDAADDAGFGAFDAERSVARRRAGELEERIRATRARYEQTERSVTTVDAPLLDEANAAQLRARLPRAVAGSRRSAIAFASSTAAWPSRSTTPRSTSCANGRSFERHCEWARSVDPADRSNGNGGRGSCRCGTGRHGALSRAALRAPGGRGGERSQSPGLKSHRGNTGPALSTSTMPIAGERRALPRVGCRLPVADCRRSMSRPLLRCARRPAMVEHEYAKAGRRQRAEPRRGAEIMTAT